MLKAETNWEKEQKNGSPVIKQKEFLSEFWGRLISKQGQNVEVKSHLEWISGTSKQSLGIPSNQSQKLTR